jgi:hypothetical protein
MDILSIISVSVFSPRPETPNDSKLTDLAFKAARVNFTNSLFSSSVHLELFDIAYFDSDSETDSKAFDAPILAYKVSVLVTILFCNPSEIRVANSSKLSPR